ncbi:MAG: mechanosensitive ion channel family protein, partial [Gammaproteobacteria bacterium]
QVGAAVISVRDFIIFVVVLAAAYGVSRMLRLVLAEEIFPRFHFPRGVPDALTLLAHYGVLLFGFLLALSSAGVDLSKVTIALSALGVGIGFGLQNVVNNFVGGLILVFEHPIQVGDYIEVGPHYGKVTRIGFRSSMVLTRDGSKVVIPNSELIGSKVVNWSLSNSIRRLIISVPVAHGSDAGQVIELLKSVAQAHPLVCEK